MGHKEFWHINYAFLTLTVAGVTAVVKADPVLIPFKEALGFEKSSPPTTSCIRFLTWKAGLKNGLPWLDATCSPTEWIGLFGTTLAASASTGHSDIETPKTLNKNERRIFFFFPFLLFCFYYCKENN